MGIVRTPAEMGHPLWTGIAAALIWLAAFRAGRLRTLAGLVGWCVAMALHSFHDGVFTLAPGKDRGPVVMDEQLLVADAFWSSLISLAFLVLGYLILRHLARELVPPGAVRTNRPHWRPQIKQWGVPRNREAARNPDANRAVGAGRSAHRPE